VHSRNISVSSNVERSESVTSNSSVKRVAPIVASSTSPLHTSGEQHDSFDNEEYDDDAVDSVIIQPIGTCVAMYPFDGKSFF
jgi:hypothetical protein